MSDNKLSSTFYCLLFFVTNWVRVESQMGFALCGLSSWGSLRIELGPLALRCRSRAKPNSLLTTTGQHAWRLQLPCHLHSLYARWCHFVAVALLHFPLKPCRSSQLVCGENEIAPPYSHPNFAAVCPSASRAVCPLIHLIYRKRKNDVFVNIWMVGVWNYQPLLRTPDCLKKDISFFIQSSACRFKQIICFFRQS